MTVNRPTIWCIALLLVAARSALAAPPPDAAQALASNLRTILLQSLPDPLHEDDKKWGQQKAVKRVVRLPRQDPIAMKNDGLWTKARVTATNPAQTLHVEVRDLQKPAADRMTFTAVVALNVHIDYDRQRWKEGVRLFSAGLRGRCRIVLALQCEVLTRVEKTTTLLPDLVFRFRVVSSQCAYDNLKVEHIAGLGGEAAEQLGKTFVNAMHQWKPSLERKLLEKANAAIVKAGDTKEVRVGLLGVMRQ